MRTSLSSRSTPSTTVQSAQRSGPGPHVITSPPLSVDTSDMRSRLTSSHFVGRGAELTELHQAFDDTASGRPGLVLVGGDSGVGKTRLVSEFEQRLGLAAEDSGVDGSGVIFLRGQSVEQSDGDLPYAPLLSALRPVVRGRHQALDELSPGDRGQLATILPGLEDDGQPRSEQRDPSGQLRLFEAMLELLEILAECEPLVLALEDVHWADRSTRAFIAFAARSLRQTRVLILLSYRTDELHRRHPLRPLLSELERLDRARRIDLRPFDRDELSDQLADILGARPDQSLLNRLLSAARVTRSTPRSCSRPAPTAAAPLRRACATRSSRGSSSCRPTRSGSRGPCRSDACSTNVSWSRSPGCRSTRSRWRCTRRSPSTC